MTTSATIEQGAMNTGTGELTVRDITYNNYGPGPAQNRTLRHSLLFKEISQRERTISNAHGDTCRWFLSINQYVQWSASPLATWRHGLLWIKGHAGSGKSTVMKFALEQARRVSSGELILSHFFNARGTPLEQSTEGMYRTLLVWLLDELPRPAVKELEDTYGSHNSNTWAISELERLLRDAVARLSDRPIAFYIDALDECDEDEVRDMLQVFSNLVEQSWGFKKQVRVCFASRPHPHIGFDAIFMDLRDQKEHIRDIQKYIQDQLRIGSSHAAKGIRQQVGKKAGGIFMWVVLVVKILNKSFDRGKISSLTSLLEDIPAGLHELFRFTLERYATDQDAMLICFRLLSFTIGRAKEWKVDSLWWAIQLGLGRPDEDIQQEYTALDQNAMERYIVEVSKGFVEIKHWWRNMHWANTGRVDTGWMNTGLKKSGSAQFVHDSVRTFVLQEAALHGAEDHHDIDAQSHRQLRDLYAAEVISRAPQLLQFIRRPYQVNLLSWGALGNLGWNYAPDDDERTRFPLAAEAVDAMLWHANEAQKLGMDQVCFLNAMTARLGLHYTYCTKRDAEGCIIVRELISVLMLQDCEALIRHTQLDLARYARQAGRAFGVLDDCFGHIPMKHALEHGHKTIRALVDLYLVLCAESQLLELQSFLQHLASAAFPESELGWWERDDEDQHLMRDLPWLLSFAPVNFDAMLSIFFLVALTPPTALEPHLDILKRLVYLSHTPSHKVLRFLQVLDFFVKHQLRCDAVDFTNPEFSSDMLRLRDYFEYQKREAEAQVCQAILDHLGVCTSEIVTYH
ncbi:hypothetical protein CC79DRAFT_1397798 [Sarocladium strictum]